MSDKFEFVEAFWMKIITYEEIYRDDMIFMVLQAKDGIIVFT